MNKYMLSNSPIHDKLNTFCEESVESRKPYKMQGCSKRMLIY